MNVQQIRCDLIDDPPWDSRIKKWGAALQKDEEEFQALKDSMDPAKGGRQIEPIVVHVVQETGRYIRGVGSRRLRATRALGLETIAADVRTEPPSVDENIIENMRRKALTPYEQARCCLQLRQEKRTSAEVARVMGFSESRVRNLSVTLKELAPPILQDWEQDHPAANIEFLRSLATKDRFPTHDDQVKAWEARKTAVAKAEETGESTKTRERQTRPTKEEKEPGIPVKQDRLAEVFNYLAPHRKLPEKIGGTRTWLRGVFNYVAGIIPVPPRDLLQALQEIKNPPKKTTKPAKKGKR
jgi:ParB/RepB/Spo0J family partition protein